MTVLSAIAIILAIVIAGKLLKAWRQIENELIALGLAAEHKPLIHLARWCPLAPVRRQLASHPENQGGAPLLAADSGHPTEHSASETKAA